MQSAQQVLTSYFQALGSKQIDKVIELVHDEAKFIILKKESSNKIPLYGTFHGKEGVRNYLTFTNSSVIRKQRVHGGISASRSM
ncbi:nuclear transport factor 2 family protein [Paenibacillus jamilae]|uniref:nuclear transport factor 2 family protein n=1 Tax=Paenibacillus jamilae TaxID=114136 RepID=UPI001E43E524|nr:nuclear transport factor 2 family protein [Paenibacillus jamilae]